MVRDCSKVTRRGLCKLMAVAGGAMALTACAGAATPTPQPTQEPVAATASEASPVAASVSSTPIIFWPQTDYVPESAEIWRAAVSRVMEANPDLDVTVMPTTYSDANEQKLLTAMASGTGPDVWSHGGSSGGMWGAKGVAAPLDDYVAESELAGDFVEAITMPHTWDGKLHAIPWSAKPMFMVMRKDHFDEVGLDAESGPADWDQLAEMGQKLAVWEGDDILRIGFGVPPAGAHFYFGLFMYEGGGHWFSDDFKSTVINSDAGVAALQFVVDLFHKYRVNATYSLESSVAGAPLLATGQLAMDWTSMTTYFYAKNSRPDLLPLFRYAMPPAGPVSQGTILFVDPLLMNKASQVKDGAWRFIEGMSSHENQEALALPQGALVPRSSWYTKYPEKAAADPIISVGMQALEMAYPIHWGPQWTPYRIALRQYIDEAVLQKRTPKDALDTAAEKLNSEILANL